MVATGQERIPPACDIGWRFYRLIFEPKALVLGWIILQGRKVEKAGLGDVAGQFWLERLNSYCRLGTKQDCKPQG